MIFSPSHIELIYNSTVHKTAFENTALCFVPTALIYIHSSTLQLLVIYHKKKIFIRIQVSIMYFDHQQCAEHYPGTSQMI